MSKHKAEVIRIEKIDEHPNADALGIVRVGGFTCCVALKDWEPRLPCMAAYVPPESLVSTKREEFSWLEPNHAEDTALIKVVRLRGIYSQGLLVPVDHLNLSVGDDASEILGITHYEPTFEDTGENEPAPGNIFRQSYDIENFNNFSPLLQPGEEVVATEKIHGENARFVWRDDRMYCGSRTDWKKEHNESAFWIAIKNHPEIVEFLKANPDCMVYGEVYGQQRKYKYGLSKDKTRIAVFDIIRGNEWLSYDEFARLAAEWNLPMTPLVYRGPFDESKLRELAEGDSLIPGAGHLREGIVIKPIAERTTPELGRVQLKMISNKYLIKS